MTEDQRDQLIEMLEQHEDDYWNLPQYGLIPDWFERYWKLHNMVCEVVDMDPYNYPMEAFDYHQSLRQKNNNK